MTIGLSYLDDLSRVRVALSDLADGTVRVERSATSGFQLPTTVRGGVELPISSGAGQVDDYEFYADVENFFRVVPVDPPAGLLLDGTSGDFASTPDDPGLEITGDVVLRAEVTYNDYGPVQQGLVAKWDSSINERSYLLFLTSGGNLRLQWSENGINAVSETSSEPLSAVAVNGQRIAIAGWLDVDLSGGGTEHRVTFYTAPTMDGPWTQLGGAQDDVGVVGPLHDGTAALTVGAFNGGTSSVANGVIHRAQVWAGTLSGGDLHTGTMLADVDFDAQPVGTTAFDDAQGNPWTVNGTATITGIEQASITPSLDGQVWLKSIRYPSQNRALFRVLDRDGGITRPANGGLSHIAGRGVPTAQFDARGSRRFVLPVQMPDQATADAFDLILAAGAEFFIHVPPSLTGKVPGGYVWIDALDERRATTSDRWVFHLPCTEIAPPGPDVVGTTFTVRQLVALQGSITAVWAAYPTIRDMWDTIGSLDDLVVL